MITYTKKMLLKDKLSFHDNHILRVYLWNENVSKLMIISTWQRRWLDYVYKKQK